jgi:hypothetical protein
MGRNRVQGRIHSKKKNLENMDEDTTGRQGYELIPFQTFKHAKKE